MHESLDPIYAAPRTPTAEAVIASAARLRTLSTKVLAAAVVTFVVGLGVLSLKSIAPLGPLLLLGSALLALAGAGYGIGAVVKGLSVASGGVGAAIAATLANLMMTGVGALAALVSTMTFTRGRQIRSGGKIMLPKVEPGAAWTEVGATSTIDIDDRATREALATQWRENGRTEHASVAAFARLTLDLMALGAPPSLVGDANRDALDEIRHAELCFGLARELDGCLLSPGAFPEAARVRMLSRHRTLALAELAVDSLVDGALHEGVSARIIAKLARRCEVPSIQAILKEIAADEGRHARHGWDVVRWCLHEGGEPVARALEGALATLPRVMASPMPDAARDGRWERWGVMGEALETEEFEATREDVVRRVGEALLASRRAAQAGYRNVSVG